MTSDKQQARKSVVGRVKALLGDRAMDFMLHSPSRLYISMDNVTAPAAVGDMFRDLGARLATITCVDTPAGFEMLYHMAFDPSGIVCTVRTLIPKPWPEVRSVTPAIPGAEWIEREIHEMFGVHFREHPNLAHLLLSDDWPDDAYPLRRGQE